MPTPLQEVSSRTCSMESKEAKLKICVGVPIIDSVPGESVGSLMGIVGEIARDKRISSVAVMTVLNMFPHDRPRNVIIDSAVAAGADLLMFVDADQTIPPNGFRSMMDVLENPPNGDGTVGLVTGFYYRRGFPYTTSWSQTAVRDGKLQKLYCEAHPSMDCVEITSCGMGCALIDLRFVRERLTKPFFGMRIVDGNVEEWEDSWFCNKITSAGGRIIGVPSVRCGHVDTRIMIDDSSVESIRRTEMLEQQQQRVFQNLRQEGSF